MRDFRVPQKHSFITTEPSTIKLYHKSYTEQFEWVLTSARVGTSTFRSNLRPTLPQVVLWS